MAVARLNNVLGRNAALPLRVADLETEPDLSLTLTQCLEVAIVERREIAAARQTVAAGGRPADRPRRQTSAPRCTFAAVSVASRARTFAPVGRRAPRSTSTPPSTAAGTAG